MSTPRICDKCKAIFSENEEGWSSSPTVIKKRDERGRLNEITLQFDQCPKCVDELTGNNNAPVRVPPVEGRYDERYTRQLEREAGIGDAGTVG